MVHLFFLMSLLALTPAFAKEGPDEIFCEVINETRSFPRVIKISGLSAERPSSSIPDAGLMFRKKESGVDTLGFSNECDNYYQLSFREDKVLKLSQGKAAYFIAHIEGHSSRYMTEMMAKYDADFTEELGESSPMICRIK